MRDHRACLDHCEREADAAVKIVNDLSDEQIGYWEDYSPNVVTMKAPNGMVDCADCTAVASVGDDGQLVVRVAWKPDEIELTHLARGGTIWLSTWGGLPPHQLEVQEP